MQTASRVREGQGIESEPSPLLYGGVTQQPAGNTLPTQFRAAINMDFSVFDGLRNRAGSVWLRDVSNGVAHLDITETIAESFAVVLGGDLGITSDEPRGW